MVFVVDSFRLFTCLVKFYSDLLVHVLPRVLGLVLLSLLILSTSFCLNMLARHRFVTVLISRTAITYFVSVAEPK